MQPVKASGWFNSGLDKQEQKELIKAGLTPVNDIFFSLWGNKNPINILFGGYGSGKSVFIETDLIEKSRQPGYFKCYFGRKVLDDVRGSVHSKFVSIIEDNNLSHEFIYSKQPNGSMAIRHIKTHNSFLPFGASKADSLKSIDDPTHFFMEEMDQFTLKDFGLILSRLRTEKGYLQLYGAFNTKSVLPDHWLIKTLFPELNTGIGINEELLKQTSDLIAEMGVFKLFCNYTDNYFINHTDYYNKLKLTAAGDKDELEAIANGKWGTLKAIRPFAHQYNPNIHNSAKSVNNPSKQLIVIVDFNIDPFGAIFAQSWQDSDGEHLHIVDELTIMNGNIPEMIDHIKARYGPQLQSCLLTGDAMGNNRTMGERDNSSNYEQLRRGLGLSNSQIKIPANPTHSNSRADVNYLLYNHPDVKVNPDKCPNLCRDLRLVEVDAFGQIIKRNRNKASQLADHLDCFRYLINTFFKGWIEKHMRKNGVIKK